ncbi:helix-turn-helix transcriptional regulator [Jannaschia ovalis]|uniref:Helix-turn-helix transcriptional regulator n=1 Tax=Jannaschia ovalis TaxID=3038773 RepID=A0ABY8LCL3_9RHOB|nr:helix-turn-helix transcriptional regulator [Jannaschia sp. GRR-S6-38]WGH78138.1 helix-turn-helix transcriptional regulator [Jannaschia sp. GRR-S6-38]
MSVHPQSRSNRSALVLTYITSSTEVAVDIGYVACSLGLTVRAAAGEAARPLADLWLVDLDGPDPLPDWVDALLDDPEAHVILLGSKTALFEARPAVCRMVHPGMDVTGLSAAVAGVLEEVRRKPSLSERERQTIALYGHGLTLKEIGGRLGISDKSAETYKARACRKLGLTGRAAILRYVQGGAAGRSTSAT